MSFDRVRKRVFCGLSAGGFTGLVSYICVNRRGRSLQFLVDRHGKSGETSILERSTLAHMTM